MAVSFVTEPTSKAIAIASAMLQRQTLHRALPALSLVASALWVGTIVCGAERRERSAPADQGRPAAGYLDHQAGNGVERVNFQDFRRLPDPDTLGPAFGRQPDVGAEMALPRAETARASAARSAQALADSRAQPEPGAASSSPRSSRAAIRTAQAGLAPVEKSTESRLHGISGWMGNAGSPLVSPLPANPGGAAPPRQVRLPVGDPAVAERIAITGEDDHISLTIREAPIHAVLGMLAEQHHLNIIANDTINQTITATLTDVRLDEALDAILSIHGYTWTRQNNIILVTEITGESKVSPLAQGQVVQVFCLNYVSGLDVDRVVKGLLSPVGQSFINQSSPLESRRTAEQIVVQDLPSYVQRVANYIDQIDRPPRQVEVEAHVLQVTLKNDTVHGVNFTALARIAKADVTWETVGLANTGATTASFLRVAGTDLKSLIEVLKATTDAKTLASPKLTVINGQDGKIQIGSKLGYKTLQTTQTSTLQNVQFLDTGVILKVTPIITQDGQVLLKVNPSVSDGTVSADTGLPNSNTTEVDTKVLLADGEAIVLGGLIKEGDEELISKIPYLGDVKYLGFLFRHRSLKRQRSEIIITLLPRIVPDVPGCRALDCSAVEQAATPLTYGPLNRVDRTRWEPDIALDAISWGTGRRGEAVGVDCAPPGSPASSPATTGPGVSAPELVPAPPALAPGSSASAKNRPRQVQTSRTDSRPLTGPPR